MMYVSIESDPFDTETDEESRIGLEKLIMGI